MNPRERQRFMKALSTRRFSSVAVGFIEEEMDKLDLWKSKYPPHSLERAYCAAHEAALFNLAKRAGLTQKETSE